MALRVFQQLTGFYINQVLIDGANEITFLMEYSQSLRGNHVDSQQSICGGHGRISLGEYYGKGFLTASGSWNLVRPPSP
jgi:anaerobic selenocysteine-containing dehydrogenase